MPTYDYRCRTCDARFEVRRPMDAPAEPQPCPHGHDDVTRVFTPVAVGGGTSTPAAAANGGGCCGGGCCG
ncbi:MAG: zinc ribbon domain-containing protein [Actinomycetota bacterium]|nr:zinc ribbon domain-containing protein [Actinomycetota bacterium]